MAMADGDEVQAQCIARARLFRNVGRAVVFRLGGGFKRRAASEWPDLLWEILDGMEMGWKEVDRDCWIWLWVRPGGVYSNKRAVTLQQLRLHWTSRPMSMSMSMSKVSVESVLATECQMVEDRVPRLHTNMDGVDGIINKKQ